MFKQNFIRLCNKNGVSPSEVCRKIGITPSAFSYWTEDSIPRKATLQKISDYFGVSAEVLTGEAPLPDQPLGAVNVPEAPGIRLTASEQEIIRALRENPDKEEAIRLILRLPVDESPAKRA